jgi:hypothetical protein
VHPNDDVNAAQSRHLAAARCRPAAAQIVDQAAMFVDVLVQARPLIPRVGGADAVEAAHQTIVDRDEPRQFAVQDL